MATTENQEDNAANNEAEPDLEEIMKTAGDFSIPIEKLVTPVERYRRITILSRKPYQLGRNMINRYFKTCKEEEDFVYVQKLANFMGSHHMKAHPIAVNSLITSLLKFMDPRSIFIFLKNHQDCFGECTRNSYETLMDACIPAGTPGTIRTIYQFTQKQWGSDPEYVHHAVELLLNNRRLGTAYSLLSNINTEKWATVSTEVMEKMLDMAVKANDRKRAEGMYTMLKAQGIDKPYVIEGKPEHCYMEEKAKEREKQEQEKKEKEKEKKEKEGEQEKNEEQTKEQEQEQSSNSAQNEESTETQQAPESEEKSDTKVESGNEPQNKE